MTGEALDLRRVALAKRLERSLVTVFCSFDQDRIAQLLVDERPLGPRCLRNLTALAQGGLHGGVSLVAGGGHADARGGRSAPAKPLRTSLHVRRELPVDAATPGDERSRGSRRRRRRADRGSGPPGPPVGGPCGDQRPLLGPTSAGRRSSAL